MGTEIREQTVFILFFRFRRRGPFQQAFMGNHLAPQRTGNGRDTGGCLGGKQKKLHQRLDDHASRSGNHRRVVAFPEAPAPAHGGVRSGKQKIG
ncbi:hypothetical protein SDC9_52473 [bioreactor metagenome]|uniref:Uncharacterized protein n=1 Tax=bioreactor metagenome TaxID=1076179 RepID=A0A644WR89_9ZZZZ